MAEGVDPGVRWHRRDPWVRPVLVVTAVLHLAAVVGQHPFVYTDSIDYETLDLTGRSRRPWVTPLLYWATDDRALRIVLQAVIGILCWQALALSASALATRRATRWAIALPVLGLSLTTTVTNWDTAMLSESLALSLTALVLAALLRVWAVRTLRSVVLALAAWVLWTFTRQNHLIIGWLVVVALAAVLLVAWRRQRRVARPLLVLLGGMVVVGALGIASYSRNTEVVHYNLAQVVGNRVFTDPGRAEWFTDHGMPVPDDHPLGIAVAPLDLLDDRLFERWVETDGVSTYARYLVEHPWYALTAPFDDYVSDRPPFGELGRPDDVMLASPDSYGVGRQVLPALVEELLFEPGQAGLVVFALAATLVLTVVAWRRRGPERRWLVPLVALAVQWPALTVVWHASTAELGRLALPSALVIRVALVVQLALLLDAWLAERAVEGGRDEDAAPAPS